MTRSRLLLALTIVGFIAPNALLVAYFTGEADASLGNYFSLWVDTLPALQLTVDLLITGLAFLAWASWDGLRSGVGRWWVVVPATFLVGLSFSVPLYLYLREQAVGDQPSRTAAATA